MMARGYHHGLVHAGPSGAFSAVALWISWGQVWQVSIPVINAISGGIGLWPALRRSVRGAA